MIDREALTDPRKYSFSARVELGWTHPAGLEGDRALNRQGSPRLLARC